MAESTGEDRAARAVGLEVTCERYVQTLVRVRRVRRAARAAARLGPLAGAVPGTDPRTVGVTGGDAREVLGKLWTAGERYRRLRESLDGSGDRVDPGGGRSAAAFADLRRRLSAATTRVRAGDYAVVAATMAEADRAIRDLRAARADDCAALAAFDPERLREAAEATAATMNDAYRARRAARATPEAEEPAGRTDSGEASERAGDATVDGADGETVAVDDAESDADAESDGRERAAEGEDTGHDGRAADAADPEAVIGSSFDIDVSESERLRAGTASPDEPRAEADQTGANDDERGEADEETDAEVGAFRFGVVTDPSDDDARD